MINNIMAEHVKNGGGRRMSRWRIAAWIAAGFILLLPLIAMQFTVEVNWTVGDFVFAGVLLFGALSTYEIAARTAVSTVYRAAVGVALTGTFLLIWVNAAVGLTDSVADGLYLGVVAVGIIGAFVARFQPVGMARALFAMALAQASVGVIALLVGLVPAHNSAVEILGITGFFVAIFVGSALLFREAARGKPERDTV